MADTRHGVDQAPRIALSDDFGGEHADVTLRADQGAAVAELIATQRVPAVLDLSLMRKTERRTFATDFLEMLYWRNRDPLHLIIDEADEFAPLICNGAGCV